MTYRDPDSEAARLPYREVLEEEYPALPPEIVRMQRYLSHLVEVEPLAYTLLTTELPCGLALAAPDEKTPVSIRPDGQPMLSVLGILGGFVNTHEYRLFVITGSEPGEPVVSRVGILQVMPEHQDKSAMIASLGEVLRGKSAFVHQAHAWFKALHEAAHGHTDCCFDAVADDLKLRIQVTGDSTLFTLSRGFTWARFHGRCSGTDKTFGMSLQDLVGEPEAIAQLLEDAVKVFNPPQAGGALDDPGGLPVHQHLGEASLLAQAPPSMGSPGGYSSSSPGALGGLSLEEALMLITGTQLLCHLFGDYLLQSDWMAQKKTGSVWIATVHAWFYVLPFLLLKPSPVAVFVMVMTHAVIDHYRLARFVCYAKNELALPWITSYVVPAEESSTGEEYEVTLTRPLRNYPWKVCKKTGYYHKSPPWLANWLLFIADNALHILINGLALAYL